VPGFNDSHLHLLGLGLGLNQMDLSYMTSIKEVITQSKKYLKTRPNLKILEGRGWHQEHFEENRFLEREDLDKISLDLPIIFRRACGHILTANSKALELIKSENLEVPGGAIDLEKGILKENAQELLLNKLPVPEANEIKEYFITGSKFLRAKGITSVQSDDFCVYPKEYTKRIYTVLESLKKDAPVRIYEQSLFRTIDHFNEYIEKGYQMTTNDTFVNWGPLKILLDGALGSKTAYLREPYKNTNEHGILMYAPERLFEYVKLADDNNIDVAIHGIGDGAIDLAIKAIENTKNINRRHSIIHCQITTGDLIDRIKKNNILVHIQPIFLDYDIHMVEDRIGSERASVSYAYQTMHRKGITIAFGSDAPVDQADPILGMHLAVNRQDLKGYPKDGWFPKEKITIEEALYFYTVNAAYAEGMEHKKGSLSLGMYADFAILDQNILTVDSKDIKDVKVLETYLGGKNTI
jgi:predicted amidohydrolase YtcJ